MPIVWIHDLPKETLEVMRSRAALEQMRLEDHLRRLVVETAEAPVRTE